ncbi:MAG: hypothetical protein QHJ81_05845 [Anaerolineae bacterium]|nr:hypothetical protein [Anaerolineae bacterium]
MSLGDYLRYLRAVKGGPTPWEIADATGVPSSIYRQMEQRYRAVGDEEALVKLAGYFQVPVEELRWRFDWPRKALSAALVAAQEEGRPIRLHLRTGESFAGRVEWWDLGAVLLTLADGQQVVVQRHVVERWET